jgi:hypothetical protein
LEEDLRTLAQSKLGQAILAEDDAPLRQISTEEEVVLRTLLRRLESARFIPAKQAPEPASVAQKSEQAASSVVTPAN